MRNLYSRMMNRSKKAFTLFEIVVVLAIITIVSAVIIPSFYNIGDRIEADKQMVEVKNVFLATDSIVDRYSDIEEARNTLFKDGRPHENLVKELASLTEIPVSIPGCLRIHAVKFFKVMIESLVLT